MTQDLFIGHMIIWDKVIIKLESLTFRKKLPAVEVSLIALHVFLVVVVLKFAFVMMKKRTLIVVVVVAVVVVGIKYKYMMIREYI